jgi:DNA-binding HxlR family transcriptional regulator
VTEDDVLAYIATAIGSVWALELLLLLKQDTGRDWEAGELIRELRSSPVVITEALNQLQNAGLVAQNEARKFRYHAASPRLDDLASAIAKLYAIKPMTVIRAIVDVRTDKLRAFSDAFKLKD